MQWFKHYINDPKKRWNEFKFGLTLFIAGAIFILAGNKYWIWLQVIGLIILAVGLLLAAKGYLGILGFRLSSAFKQLKPPPSRFDKDK